MGGVSQAGCGCLCPEYTLLSAIFRHMRLLPDEVVLLDTPAGMEHFGRAVADGFSCALVVADPSYNALSVARESAGFTQQLGIKNSILVVNRVGNPADVNKIHQKIEGFTGFSHLIFLPVDPEIIPLEPAVNRLLSGESSFINEIRRLSAIVTDTDEKQPSVDIKINSRIPGRLNGFWLPMHVFAWYPPSTFFCQLLLPDRDTLLDLLNDITGACICLGTVPGTHHNDKDILTNRKPTDPVDDIDVLEPELLCRIFGNLLKFRYCDILVCFEFHLRYLIIPDNTIKDYDSTRSLFLSHFDESTNINIIGLNCDHGSPQLPPRNRWENCNLVTICNHSFVCIRDLNPFAVPHQDHKLMKCTSLIEDRSITFGIFLCYRCD